MLQDIWEGYSVTGRYTNVSVRGGNQQYVSSKVQSNIEHVIYDVVCSRRGLGQECETLKRELEIYSSYRGS